MHSEYTDGLLLRPLMDAGWTAWRDGQRLGIARLVEGEIVVDAADPRVREVLARRLEADARAAGIDVAGRAPESDARLADAA